VDGQYCPKVFDDNQNNPFITWGTFEMALKKAFGHTNDVVYAVTKLVALRMKGSAEEGIVKFETLQDRTG